MIIIDNSLDIKIDIVKNLLNNKKTFFIMINNEFIYNYIMELLYQKEINWKSGRITISKQRDFSWFKNEANGTFIFLYYSVIYKKYELGVITENIEYSRHDIIYF